MDYENWRDIPGSEVNWESLVPGFSTAMRIKTRFEHKEGRDAWDTEHAWEGMTLGHICDLGVREWNRYPGWGEKTCELLKDALRIIAKDPNNARHYMPHDAFDPERD